MSWLAPTRATIILVSLLATFSAILPNAARAQGGATGAITATVLDRSGGFVPGAAIKIIDAGTGQQVRDLAAGANGEEIRRLYSEIEREHQKLGKNPNVTFEQLRSMVEKQSEQVRARYNVDVVGFRVDVVDGKVKLKAKPIQE